MTTTRSADVVIVGGGIIGCLTAYYLTLRGVKCIVIEADAVASGASGNSAGWLTPYSYTCDPAMLALSPETLRLHAGMAEALPEDTGIDHGYQLTPYLRCATTDEGVRELRSFQTQRATEGTAMTWLSPGEARAITPWITADIAGALRSDSEPMLDSYRLTISALQAAEKRGAEVVAGRVVGLLPGSPSSSEPRTAAGVRLADGSTVRGGAVLLAMGPWTGQAAEWLGHPVPVTPQRGQLVYLAPPRSDEGPDLAAGLTLVEDGGSILPKRLSDTIVAATQEDAGFDVSTTTEARDTLLKRGARLSERVMTARISDQTACLRPLSDDGKPYVGRAPGWANAYMAAGHTSEGVHYAPVTAKAIAGLIADGRSEYDISALDPARAASPTP